jgi:hypothetical protein
LLLLQISFHVLMLLSIILSNSLIRKTNNDAYFTQILIISLSVFQAISTLIITQFVEKLGRKLMILKGQGVISVSLIFIAFIDKVFSEIIGFTAASIIITILIFMHLLYINLTLGPCCIIYCTEIVADITWIIITIKGLTLLIAFTSQYMIEYLGLGYMFLIFFGFTFWLIYSEGKP